MAWRELENGQYSGDQSADVVSIGLEAILADFPQKCSFYAFMTALFSAMLTFSKTHEIAFLQPKILAGFKTHIFHIEKNYADFEAGSQQQLWIEMLNELAAVYQKAWNRKPTMQEIVANFSYVVTALPEGTFYDLEAGELIYLAIR